jgi:hypothetical protein
MSNYYSSDLQWLGAGKETAWGTAASSTYFIPFKDCKPVDKPEIVKDEGTRGVMAGTFGAYQSIRTSTFDCGGEVFPDSIGLFLLGMFGSDTVTGTTAKTHTFSLAQTAQPPSLTLNYFNGNNERAFAGQKLEELTFKWAIKSALEWSAKSTGKISTVVGSTETVSLAATAPIMSWAFALQLATVANLNLESFEISLKRKSDAIHAANNSQDPAFVNVQGMSATGKMSFAYTGDPELLLALNNTQEAITFVGTQAGTGYGVTFQLTKAYFSDPSVSGKDHMTVDMDFEGIFNSADAGPCTISLINSVTSY